MTHDDLLALFDREQRQEITYYGFRREVLPGLVRMLPVKPPYKEGAIVYAHLAEADADQAIVAQIAYFQSQGYGFEWKSYNHDAPADLPERLLRHGFTAEEPESVLVLDLREPRGDFDAAPSATVRCISDPDDLDDVINVLADVWGDESAWLGPVLADELSETPDNLRIYVADVEGIPASAAWIRFHPNSQFASLWGGSTIARCRGRGLYRALLSVRAREARERGVRYLTVDAGPMSRPILERLGFRHLTATQPFKWSLIHHR